MKNMLKKILELDLEPMTDSSKPIVLTSARGQAFPKWLRLPRVVLGLSSGGRMLIREGLV